MSRAERRREQRQLAKAQDADTMAMNTVRQILKSHQDCSFDELCAIVKSQIEAVLYKKIFDEVNETIITALSCATIMAARKLCPNWVPVTKDNKPGMLWKLMEGIHDSYIECEEIIKNKGMQALKDVVYDGSGIDFEYSPSGNKMEAKIIMGDVK